MTDDEISRAALGAIRASGIDYVLVGGLAVIAHTFPRTTLDVNFVVAPELGAMGKIAAHFPPTFRVDPQPQTELLTSTYRWIVEEEGSIFRVEIIHLGTDPHHHEIFRRRLELPMPALGGMVWIPTAEDLVIQKLRWARGKDLEDVRNILSGQGEAVDYAHLETWCGRHGTLERLAEVRAGIPPGL